MNIRPLIDSTLLKADATHDDIVKLCREACHFGFAAVCVNSYRLPLAVEHLAGSSVAACAVVAFPLGALLPRDKAGEVERVLSMGAKEVDMVVNIGAVKDRNYAMVTDEIQRAVNEVKKTRSQIKIIVETALLTREELGQVCRIAQANKADFIKTSTGYSSRGASVEDVRFLRELLGDDMKIKASGGIRDYDFACQLVMAGANRLGISNAGKLWAV